MPELIPSKLLDGVIRHLDPIEVYVFGSRARGGGNANSDIDLYVIVDDETEDAGFIGDAVRRSREGYAGAVDILMTPRSRFESRRKVLGTLDEIVDHEGVRVYVRD